MVIDQALFINNANFAVNLNRANNILVQNTVVVGQVTPPSNKNCLQNSALTGAYGWIGWVWVGRQVVLRWVGVGGWVGCS